MAAGSCCIITWQGETMAKASKSSTLSELEYNRFCSRNIDNVTYVMGTIILEMLMQPWEWELCASS